jgi:hypothetical protein
MVQVLRKRLDQLRDALLDERISEKTSWRINDVRLEFTVVSKCPPVIPEPEPEERATPMPSGVMSGSFDVFLSHNSKDKPTVRQLARALQARGLKVWLDEEQLVPGRPWHNKDRNISCISQFTQNTDSLFIKRTDQEISQSR